MTAAFRPAVNRQVRLVKRAYGIPAADCFEIGEGDMPVCPQGGVVVRVMFAGVDPAMRGWVSTEQNYLRVETGAVMRAEGVGEVIESRSADWKIGECLYGEVGWQHYAAMQSEQIHWRVDLDLAPAPVWLGALGLNGLAAWVGFQHLARPRRGETVLVSTAAGAVGSVVASLARAAGVMAVGLTGSAEKVRRCIEELGYAAALDYHGSDLSAALEGLCPRGIDIFFDNTGGLMADAAFPLLNRAARIVQCGTASVERWNPVPLGPRRERDMIVKRLSWCGFVVIDHPHLYAQALQDLTQLYRAGLLDARTEVLQGLEAAPDAIARLYRGENQGRLCIAP